MTASGETWKAAQIEVSVKIQAYRQRDEEQPHLGGEARRTVEMGLSERFAGPDELVAALDAMRDAIVSAATR